MPHWIDVTAATASLLATIGDPDGTRTLTSLIALLVAMGLALAMVAVWLYRATRPDPELLAPLEAMGERSWQRLDPVGQRRRLDELRPDGAEPISSSVAPPVIDETFDAEPAAPDFDDLRDDPSAPAERNRSEHDWSAFGVELPSTFAGTPPQIDRPGIEATTDADDERDGGDPDRWELSSTASTDDDDGDHSAVDERAAEPSHDHTDDRPEAMNDAADDDGNDDHQNGEAVDRVRDALSQHEVRATDRSDTG